MFDGLATKTLLAGTARALGITPISEEVLDAHKRTEVAKHPASWWYHHRDLPPLLVCISFGLIMTGVMTNSFAHDANPVTITGTFVAVLFGGFLCVILTGGVINNIRIKGPASWVELSPEWETVPSEIVNTAQRIMALVPGSYATVGELRQNTVVLDPYLIVCYGTEQLVIGIWDDTGIIHQATCD